MDRSLSPHDEFRWLARDMRVYLEALRSWGVQDVPAAPQAPQPKVPERSAPAPVAPSLAAPSPAREQALFPLAGPEDRLQRLALPELEAVARECTA